VVDRQAIIIVATDQVETIEFQNELFQKYCW